MRIAIIIPTLNEEGCIASAVRQALTIGDEVWVADGGSADGTCTLARSLGARVVCGPPSRGRQLNLGARAASADILLFLHADSQLPASAAERIREAVTSGAIGGGFQLRFDSERWVQRLGAWLINLRTRLAGWPLGDQAQFARRADFVALGGFRDWPILEDLDFIRRLAARGRIVVLEERVTTSARRFLHHGAVRTVATNWLIWGLYLCGVPPSRLAALYRHVR